ncbi:hypothetical protein BpHYR1_018304, partial [Brachionus plicatilis]
MLFYRKSSKNQLKLNRYDGNSSNSRKHSNRHQVVITLADWKAAAQWLHRKQPHKLKYLDNNPFLVRYKFELYFLENIINSESIFILKFYINLESHPKLNPAQ